MITIHGLIWSIILEWNNTNISSQMTGQKKNFVDNQPEKFGMQPFLNKTWTIMEKIIGATWPPSIAVYDVERILLSSSLVWYKAVIKS